jgi:hypothetical protein
MGQKANPISLRLQYNNRHFDSCWYSDHFYTNLLSRELMVQKYINTFLKILKLPLARINIQFCGKKTQLYTLFCYPKQSREFNSKLFQITSGFPHVITENGTSCLDFEKQKKSITNLLLWDSLFSDKYIQSHLSLHKLRNITKNPHSGSTILLPLETAPVTKTRVSHKKSNKVLNNMLMTNVYHTLSMLGHLHVTKENKENTKGIVSSIKIQTVDKQIKATLKYFLIFKELYKSNTLILFTQFLRHPARIKHYAYSFSQNLNTEGRYTLSQREIAHPTKVVVKCTKALKALDLDTLLQTHLFSKTNDTFTHKFPIYENESFMEQGGSDVVVTPQTSISRLLLSISSRHLETKYRYKNYIENYLSSISNSKVSFLPIRSSQDWQSAGFIADELVYLLENRVTFRRLKARLLKQLSEQSEILGVRISCSGRVGGKSKKSQRAKLDFIKYGQTSLHVFSSRVDFAVRTAHTGLGSMGIKIWVCYK